MTFLSSYAIPLFDKECMNMKSRNPKLTQEIQGKRAVGRRDFFKGAAAGAAALVGTRAGGSALVRGVAGGAAALIASGAGNALAAGVSSYTLTASEVNWPVRGGRTASAYAYSVDGGLPTVPGPMLEATEGDLLQITVVNNLTVPTTVHWHGVHTVPNNMDGVPGVTQAPIPPGGGSFAYEFNAPAAGTYVYHSHYDTPNQLPRGLYGLLVVRPRGRARGRRYHYDREFPLVLGTFPASIVSPPLPPGEDDVQLINGQTFPTLVENCNLFYMNRGDRVLFRIWNASNEVHPMHTHGMHYDVVAADSMDLEVPLHRDTMGVNAGERYDIIAHADNPGTWLFHCHNLDHVLEGMIAVNIVT